MTAPASVPASTIAVLGTVDSTNTLVAHAIASSRYSDARDRVEHLFEGGGSAAEGGTGPVPVSGTLGIAYDSSRKEASQASGTVASNEGRTASRDDRRRSGAGDCPVPFSVAVSDVQTQCRGRLGRAWYNRPGQSLLASWAFAVPTGLAEDGARGGWLTMAAGLAVIAALREVLAEEGSSPVNSDPHGQDTDDGLRLKWPNDVFCRGRKLAGILNEYVPVDEDWSALVVGVGLNLFVPVGDLPTDLSTSLQLLFAPLAPYGQLRDRLVEAVGAHLSQELSPLIAQAAPGGAGATGGEDAFEDLRRRVLEVSWTLGRDVRVRPISGPEFTGRALAINPDASLQVLLPDGSQLAVTTGDVGVLPAVGPGAGSPDDKGEDCDGGTANRSD